MPDSTDSPQKKRVKAVRERSAGIVVFRENPATSQHEFLLLNYGRHWDYPKGHLEKGEGDTVAALRELREETGITNVTLLPKFSREIMYHFQSSRKGLVRKEVIFFGARIDFEGSEAITISREHVGFQWIASEAALERLTFANAKAVLASLIRFLSTNPENRDISSRALTAEDGMS